MNMIYCGQSVIFTTTVARVVLTCQRDDRHAGLMLVMLSLLKKDGATANRSVIMCFSLPAIIALSS